MNVIYNPLKLIIEDHQKFIHITSDVIAHSINDTQWTRIKTLLSPETRFKLTDPLMFSFDVMYKIKPIPSTLTIFNARNIMEFHMSYEFPSWEGSSCTEFLLRGPRILQSQVIDCPGVMHKLHVPGLKDTELLNIYGIVTVEKTELADTYSRLTRIPFIEEMLRNRNYYNKINKNVLTEVL